MKRENEFKDLAKNLHHLLSTRQIRGVYNPLTHLVMVRDRLFFTYFLLPFFYLIFSATNDESTTSRTSYSRCCQRSSSHSWDYKARISR